MKHSWTPTFIEFRIDEIGSISKNFSHHFKCMNCLAEIEIFSNSKYDADPELDEGDYNYFYQISGNCDVQIVESVHGS